MKRSRIVAVTLATIGLFGGSLAWGAAAQAATTGITSTSSTSSTGVTLSFPTTPTFPTFPPTTPAPPPINTATNGTTSIVQELVPGGEENDGAFDINEFDYHITALLVQDVLAADPKGPVSVLADGTQRATFFQPDDEEWVQFVHKLTGQSLPLSSAASEKKAYQYLQGLGTTRLQNILSYLIIPGVTLTGSLLGPPTISEKTYTTANGQTILVKSDFGVVTLVDNSPLTANSGIVEAPMNQGNRQIAWSTGILLPSVF